MNIDQVLARFKLADNRRRNWENLYREAMFYTMPERDKFYETNTSYTEGTREDYHLHTSLPLLNLEEFADNLSSAMTPYGGEWFTLDAEGGPGFNNEPKEIQDVLIEVQMQAQAAIMSSNYHTEVVQAFLDLGMGTMSLWVGQSQDNKSELRFESIPLPELIIEKGYTGIASGIFRRRMMSVRACEKKYPKHDFSKHIDESQLDDRSKEDPKGKEIELIECCIEKEVNDRDNGAFYYTVIDKDKTVEIKEAVKHMSYNPYIIARWSVVGGETYGRGPAVQCLGDIKQLNKLIEYIFRATFRNIAPPVLAADDGVLNPNTAVLSPDSVIPVRSTNPQSSYGTPQVLDTTGDFQLSLINQDELKMRISEHFLVEQFGDTNDPSQSPEEVYVRHQRFQRRVGSKYPRLVNEFMRPLVNNVLESMNLSGELKQRLGERKIVYSVPRSPSEQQRRATSIQRFMQTLGAVHPGAILAAVHPAKLITELADAEGVPPEIVKSEDEINQGLEQAMQAAQQQPQEGQEGQGGQQQQPEPGVPA